jgi:hypothetical protein
MRHDPLAELIRSLTKAEKRYFKLSTNLQKGNKKYIELFDALDKGEEFRETSGSRSQLPVLRNYLQHLILRGLRSFHEEASLDIELRNELSEIELLFSRKHYTLATRILERAKKRALAHERYPIVLQLIDWEMRLNGPESSSHQQEIIERVHEDWREAMTRFEEIRVLRKIYDDTYFHKMQKGLARDAESEQEYHALVDHPLLKDPPEKLTFQGQVLYYLIYSRYYHAIGKLDLDSKSSKAVLTLFDKHPERIIDLESYYNRAVLFQLNEAMGENRYDVAYSMIDRLRRNKYAFDPEQNRFTALLLEFGILQGVGMFEQAQKLVPELIRMRDQELARRSKWSLAIIDDQLSRQFFAMGDYDNALEWSNRILYQKGGVLGQNLQSTVRILVLMSHFELANYKYLKYATKAAYQYLYRHDRLFPTEKRLLSFFSTADKSTKPEDFLELKRDLDAIKASPLERTVVDYSDLFVWVRAKAESRTFHEIVRADPEHQKWIKYFTKLLKK